MQPLPRQRISSNAVISSMLPDLQRNKLDLSTLIGLFEHFPLGIVICPSGDEFLILLGEIEQPEDAIQVTEQILSFISQTDLNGVSANLTASIGISVFPDECREFDKLLEHSDNAMYEAKRQGKNRYFYAGSSARM